MSNDSQKIYTAFFDLGCRGAVAVFLNKKLIFYQQIILTNKQTMPPQQKVQNFMIHLKKIFPNPEKFSYTGTYEPIGINRRTSINLSFLIGVLMLYFFNATNFLLTESVVFQELISTKQLPNRIFKKKQTIKWINRKFSLKLVNDDLADAIIGGHYFVINKFN